MSNFYVNLTKEEMAAQVAALLNGQNQLTTTYTPYFLMVARQDYFVEVYGSLVVGCAALEYENSTWSKIKHVSVRPEFQRRGIAKRILTTILGCCKSENVYMTIREDNKPSLAMANSLGFVVVKREWIQDHYLLAVGRKVNDVRTGQAAR
jgi:GNAT superfamily N-acetyltransferase